MMEVHDIMEMASRGLALLLQRMTITVQLHSHNDGDKTILPRCNERVLRFGDR